VEEFEVATSGGFWVAIGGWVNYFAIGHSSRCFGFVRNWVEKKIRRHGLAGHLAQKVYF
jgi:hypothetical protein